jgi:hypothetical protein
MIKGFLGDYSKDIPLDLTIDKDTILVSHTPSLEAVFICKALKNKYKNLRYIQYWSDPIALSGIMPENFNLKRKPFYWLEKKAYDFADEIVFGTATLCKMNSNLYPKFKNKMRSVDWAYLHKDKDKHFISKGFKEFIYAGNYYSSIRNIKPLYDAFNELGNEYHLSVYGNSDIELEDTENVSLYSRISPDELVDIECSYRNTISLLNYSCMQIPGKTFYQTDLEQVILVIADGTHSEELKEYLAKYNRFIICNNNKEDIKQKILEISQMESYECPDEVLELLSPKNVSYNIINGSELVEYSVY